MLKSASAARNIINPDEVHLNYNFRLDVDGCHDYLKLVNADLTPFNINYHQDYHVTLGETSYFDAHYPQSEDPIKVNKYDERIVRDFNRLSDNLKAGLSWVDSPLTSSTIKGARVTDNGFIVLQIQGEPTFHKYSSYFQKATRNTSLRLKKYYRDRPETFDYHITIGQLSSLNKNKEEMDRVQNTLDRHYRMYREVYESAPITFSKKAKLDVSYKSHGNRHVIRHDDIDITPRVSKAKVPAMPKLETPISAKAMPRPQISTGVQPMPNLTLVPASRQSYIPARQSYTPTMDKDMVHMGFHFKADVNKGHNVLEKVREDLHAFRINYQDKYHLTLGDAGYGETKVDKNSIRILENYQKLSHKLRKELDISYLGPLDPTKIVGATVSEHGFILLKIWHTKRMWNIATCYQDATTSAGLHSKKFYSGSPREDFSYHITIGQLAPSDMHKKAEVASALQQHFEKHKAFYEKEENVISFAEHGTLEAAYKSHGERNYIKQEAVNLRATDDYDDDEEMTSENMIGSPRYGIH